MTRYSTNIWPVTIGWMISCTPWGGTQPFYWRGSIWYFGVEFFWWIWYQLNFWGHEFLRVWHFCQLLNEISWSNLMFKTFLFSAGQYHYLLYTYTDMHRIQWFDWLRGSLHRSVRTGIWTGVRTGKLSVWIASSNLLFPTCDWRDQ